MLKKIKNLLTNSTKLENNPKLKQKIQTYLRKLKSNAKESSRRSKSLSGKSGRGSRNMKLKLSSTSANSTKIHKTKKNISKADSKKRLMLLLSVAKKKMQDERKARASNLQQTPIPSRNNKTNRLTHTTRPQSPRNRQMNSPPKSRQANYESHPIWDYFHRLQGGSAQPPSSRARRLTRRLF